MTNREQAMIKCIAYLCEKNLSGNQISELSDLINPDRDKGVNDIAGLLNDFTEHKMENENEKASQQTKGRKGRKR